MPLNRITLGFEGNVGHWCNEEADRLARESVNQTSNVQGIPPPYTHFKIELWDVMYGNMIEKLNQPVQF